MSLYEYFATVVRVIDGDSLIADVDLGFNVVMTGISLRLAGCNAREQPMPGGPEAADNLRELLPAGAKVRIRSYRIDKYGGRYDASITCKEPIFDLSSHLVRNGWAASWDGKGPRPIPPWPRVIPPETFIV